MQWFLLVVTQLSIALAADLMPPRDANSVMGRFYQNLTRAASQRPDDCQDPKVLAPIRADDCAALRNLQFDRSDQRQVTANWLRACHNASARANNPVIRRQNVACTPEALNRPAPAGRWVACETKRSCNREETEIHDRHEALVHRTLQIDCNATQFANLSQQAKDQETTRLRSERQKIGRLPDCIPLLDEARAVVVHHSALPVSWGPRELQLAHLYNRNWSDLGYHYVIAPDERGQWQVYEGRSSRQQGAHVGPGMNSGSLGVLIVGNYTDEPRSASNPSPRTAEAPPAQAVQRLDDLMSYLKQQHPSIQRITSHQSMRASTIGCNDQCPPRCQTLCPGHGIISVIDALQERMSQKRSVL